MRRAHLAFYSVTHPASGMSEGMRKHATRKRTNSFWQVTFRSTASQLKQLLHPYARFEELDFYQDYPYQDFFLQYIQRRLRRGGLTPALAPHMLLIAEDVV